MALKPPLTFGQLREIQERNKDSADVIALLWEIKRLHWRVIRLDQLVNSATGGTVPATVLDAARQDLEGEPALAQHHQWKSDLLKP
jgi:hypothetical protein